MEIIRVTIAKDSNTVKFIKLIREFESSLSMGEIKAHIENGEPVISFDMDSNDWIHMEDMTEEKWQLGFYSFLDKLRKSGAVLTLTEEYDGKCEDITMEQLADEIRNNKELWDELETYPD